MLLDSWLGVHHGTTYRRTELKTLVSLHQVDGIGELTDDEVTIIASVLDLKEKPISAVMTPLEDVFTLSEDAILDEHLMEEIVSAGYSRIPIYRHDDACNFIGMLLVKRLITYDPQDHIPVRQFTINSLPEAAPNTSCLDILNFFQEGRSHMAIVTSESGGFGEPVGVITLEDVIEELLGEEIVDESDVYVDVRNKIKVIRKPSKNANMIRNLKSLLRSPGLSESTPLLGNAGAKGGRAVDNKYMTTGKTIVQSRQASSALLDTAVIANTGANIDAHTAANTAANAASAHKDATSAGAVAAGVVESSQNGTLPKDNEVMEVAKPREVPVAGDHQGQAVVIDVPEPGGTYPIGAVVVESALVTSHSPSDSPGVQNVQPRVGDSSGTTTVKTTATEPMVTTTTTEPIIESRAIVATESTIVESTTIEPVVEEPSEEISESSDQIPGSDSLNADDQDNDGASSNAAKKKKKKKKGA
ncbi:hypothetical protein BGZ65_008739, partial [Modicella reniformis]